MPRSANWNTAKVAEPMGFVDEDMNTVGTFVIVAGVPTILSLNPAEDFELNTDIIHQWKLIFQTSDKAVLGDADYETGIKELGQHIVDQQNGSILIDTLTDDELEDVFSRTIFS